LSLAGSLVAISVWTGVAQLAALRPLGYWLGQESRQVFEGQARLLRTFFERNATIVMQREGRTLLELTAP
jgi:hypothetical protein